MDVPSARNKIQAEQVDLNSPHSESLNTNYAANINSALDFMESNVAQAFTSSGTYNVPDGVANVMVEAIGGGGGGQAGHDVNADGGHGGNGGVHATRIIPVTALSSITVTIGGGGSGGSGAGGAGSPGANTIFGAHSWLGGTAGGTPIGNENNGTAKGGDNRFAGEGLFAEGGTSGGTQGSGGGGGAGFGQGGNGGSTAGSGGANSGAGGAGGQQNGNAVGGSGGTGFLRVTNFPG